MLLFDEPWFKVFWANVRISVCQKPHEAMNSNCRHGIVRVGSVSIMVMCMCSHGVGLDLMIHLNLLTSDIYIIAPIRVYLHPFMDTTYPAIQVRIIPYIIGAKLL